MRKSDVELIPRGVFISGVLNFESCQVIVVSMKWCHFQMDCQYKSSNHLYPILNKEAEARTVFLENEKSA